MKNSHLPWVKKEQTSHVIDLEKLFNNYWTSKAHEITAKGQSWSSTVQSSLIEKYRGH